MPTLRSKKVKWFDSIGESSRHSPMDEDPGRIPRVSRAKGQCVKNLKATFDEVKREPNALKFARKLKMDV